MRSAGVCVESFLKIFFPLLSSRVNYRNHRKLVVVDGKVGLVGGCNIADRYLEGINGGCWRDTMLLLRGAAVKGLQASFVVDWYFANRSKISGERYFPLSADAGRKSYVQVVTSNPVGNLRVIIAGYIKILSQARGYVYLQTPYFMPDETFLQALKSASMSGVDVRLMIPEHSDSRIADYATTSHLGELLESGIKVFLYRGGVLHCKSVVCDDYISSIGSANLDFRSFFYNFEISAFVYDRRVAVDLKECFINDMKLCRQLTLNEYRTRPFIRRCTESLVKLLSPLL
jgi:cardiolipin synthase